MQGTHTKGLLGIALSCLVCVATSSFSAGLSPHFATSVDARSSPIAVLASGRRQAPNASVATWKMPWQIRPIGYRSRASRERIVEAIVRKTGRVRGTPAAIATVGRLLRPVRGPNRAVRACRAAVAKEAIRLGAREIEAVSAGRERPTASRNFVAPVRFRISYRRRRGYEVRLSVLTCVVTRKGRLLDAFVPAEKPPYI